MSLSAAMTQSIPQSSSGLIETGSMGMVLALLATFGLLAIFAFGFVFRLRLIDQIEQLEGVLKALSGGERGRRTGFVSGPLVRVGKAVDEYADKVSRRLNDAEIVHTELEHLVTRDRLTGLGNRQHFEQQIELEAARGKRYHVPVSLILIDVDHFKRINDTYGHSVGDSVLIDITRRIASQLRDTDTISRWGGEEFAVIAPCTPMLGAEIIAEKLRKIVAESPFEAVGHVTISAGVAQLLPGERARHWVARADRFLYQAKESGRNRICSNAESGQHKTPFILVWGEQFHTGQSNIDKEHAEIFRLANEVVLLHEDAPLEVSIERLDALLSHLALHFRTEESALFDLGCPEHEVRAHAGEHQGLITQAIDLRRRLLAKEIGRAELVDFIIRRIAIGHVVGADLPMFASLTTSTTMAIPHGDRPSIRVKLQRAFLS
jgi:diguanylate cyclase (GGDEF)-like protein/hemerythrin-like metal-binding protein